MDAIWGYGYSASECKITEKRLDSIRASVKPTTCYLDDDELKDLRKQQDDMQTSLEEKDEMEDGTPIERE